MPSEPFLIAAIALIAALTRSTFGFGDALVGMPLLSMAIGIRTATPLVALIAMTSAVVILLQDWRSIGFYSVGRLFFASLLGLPVGVVVLKYADETLVMSILAGVIILFSAYALFQPRLVTFETDRPAWIFGFLAGVLGGAYNVLGPPVVLFGTLRQWSAEHFRATLQGYFFPTGLLILAGHGLAGLWTSTVWQHFATAAPVAVVAVPVGRWLNRQFEAEKFTRCVHGLLIIIGLVLLFSAVQA